MTILDRIVDALHSAAQWVRDTFRRAMNRIGGGQGEE
jgi:hypothetical protein